MASTPTAETQGELWGRQPHTWATLMEPQLRPLYQATLDALEPLAGLRLLDAGCGTGLVLRMAADRGATVAGLDASPPLLDIARDRLPEAVLRVGDIQSIPHDDGAFDVVCAFNALQYTADPTQAAAELARVCRPGGRLAIGVWGDPERCETETLFAQLRALAPPPPGAPAPLAISAPGVVESLLAATGLTPLGGSEVQCPFTFTDLEQAWTGHTSAGPLQKVIDTAGPDTVRAVLTEVLDTDRKPDGQLRQDNVFRYITVTKPLGIPPLDGHLE